MVQILVVEDDYRLNQVVCNSLKEHGFTVTSCSCPEEAYDLMEQTVFDMIISDVMMPATSGFEFAETIRKCNNAIPIIFMTALDDIASKQAGYLAGIDDYVVKPFEMAELILRVNALLRRSNISSQKRLTLGSFTMDENEMSAYVNGKEIPLTIREFQILYKLLSYPKQVFSRDKLIEESWGLESNTSHRTIDVYITRLRQKFFNCKDFQIITVYSIGYKAVLT